MNNKHAIISNLGGKCVVMEWKPSAIIEGETELAYQSFSSFKDRYLNRYVEMPNVKGLMRGIPTAPYWLAHPDRRQYEALILSRMVRLYYQMDISIFGVAGVLILSREVGSYCVGMSKKS